MADNLLTRDDTFLGICEGLGEDLHIPANLLRIGLAVLMLSHPLMAIGLYLSLGVIVLLSRIAFPARVRGRTVRTQRAVTADNANDPPVPLAQAA